MIRQDEWRAKLDEAIVELNKEWCVVFHSGRIKVQHVNLNGQIWLDGNEKPEFLSFRDFENLFMSRRVQTEYDGRLEPLGRVWLRHSMRRENTKDRW
jgi:hypothetical protein